jgi:hypothetical protein
MIYAAFGVDAKIRRWCQDSPMAATPKELYEMAMSLNHQERAELIGLLPESLEILNDEGIEPAWLKEIERRVAEIDSGAVESAPWTELRAGVFQAGAH